MKNLFSVAVTAALLLGGASAASAEPTWEVMGFPITPHQISVLGSELRAAHLKERAPAPTLTLAGMPASPHQVAVLTPPPRITEQQIAEEPIKAGFSQVRFVDPSEQTAIALRNGERTELTIDGRAGTPCQELCAQFCTRGWLCSWSARATDWEIDIGLKAAMPARESLRLGDRKREGIAAILEQRDRQAAEAIVGFGETRIHAETSIFDLRASEVASSRTQDQLPLTPDWPASA